MGRTCNTQRFYAILCYFLFASAGNSLMRRHIVGGDAVPKNVDSENKKNEHPERAMHATRRAGRKDVLCSKMVGNFVRENTEQCAQVLFSGKRRLPKESL